MVAELITCIQHLVEQGKFEKANKLIEENEGDNYQTSIELIIFKVKILRSLGKFEKAKLLISELYKRKNTINNMKIELQIIIEDAYFNWNITNHDKTLELVKQGKILYKLEADDIEHIEAEISTLDNLHGLYNIYAGDLNEALRYFELALLRRQRIKQKYMIAISLNNVGTCYYRKGELDKSLEYFQDSRDLFLEINNNVDIGLPYSNLALIYYDFGNLESALEYFEKSIIIQRELGNPINIAETYFGLIRTHLKLKDEQQSYEYILMLKELDDNNNFQLITQWYKLSNAMYLMNKPRINQKIIAQTLLTEIVGDQVLHQKLTITAMKELCKFYILELQLFGGEEALRDAIDLVNQLYDTAQDQLSFSLLVEVFILNAKLSLIQSDYQGAIIYLDQAEFTSYEKGLIGLEMQVKMEKVALEAEAEKWRLLSVKNASLKEKIEQSRIFDYLKDIRKAVEDY